MSSSAKAAVVVVSGRSERLGFVLEALAGQTRADVLEVVVALDGPLPHGLPTAGEGLKVKVVKGPGDNNIARLRNLGWRACEAPFVAFTDDDCRPAPSWIEALLAAQTSPDDIVQGRTEPDPDELGLLHGLARTQRIEGPSPWFQTCNVAYPRALLERLEGFDESFASLGEDADLGLRATDAGARVVYAEDALVHHGVIPRSLPRALSEALRRNTMPRLLARHPAARGDLYAGVFWRPRHAKLILGIAGAALARRTHGASLVLALPYVREAGVPGGALGAGSIAHATLTLGSRAVVDLAEVLAAARASAGERCLVL